MLRIDDRIAPEQISMECPTDNKQEHPTSVTARGIIE